MDGRPQVRLFNNAYFLHDYGSTRHSSAMEQSEVELAVCTELLTRRYPGGQGITDVSLQVPRGCIYGFLGPNGSGKTTTIRLLLGLLHPQRGRIELLGQSLHSRPSVLGKVGALVESPSLYPHLSGRQNLDVTRRLLGLPPAAADRVLELTGLADAAQRRVAEYSLGMRQRLGIALALLGTPELLILDEPSNGLDPAGMADLRRMLRTFTQEMGVTVFVSSHLLGEVEQVATHVGVLHAGQLRFQGSIDALRERNRPQVRLRCQQPDAALAWLCDHRDAGATRTDEWITVVADSHEVPRLINSLFTAGIEVLDMTLQQSSLESLFMDLTRDAAREAA